MSTEASLKNEKFHLSTIKDIEISLRKRARNCREFSWVFLFVIILTIIVSGFIIAGLISQVQSVEAVVLSNFSNQLKQRLSVIENNIDKISPEIEVGIGDIRDFLNGVGVNWESLSEEDFSDRVISDLKLTNDGELLVLIGKENNLQVLKSSDKGASWEAGQAIVGRWFGTDMNLIDDYMYILDTRSQALYLSGDKGMTFEKHSMVELGVGRLQPYFTDTYHSDLLAVMVFTHDSEERKVLLFSFETGELNVADYPSDLESVWTFNFSEEGLLEVVGHNSADEAQYWFLTPETKQWSNSISIPKAKKYIEIGEQIFLINTDSKNEHFHFSIWDPKLGILGELNFPIENDDKEYWASDEYKFSSLGFLRNENKVDKVEELYRDNYAVDIAKGPSLLISKQSNNEYVLSNLGSSFKVVGESTLLISGKTGKTIHYFDESKLTLVEGPSINDMGIEEDILYIKKIENSWLALSSSKLPGEKGIIVYQKLDNDLVWRRRHPPAGMIKGKVWGGYDHIVFSDGTIIISANFSSLHSQVLRSIPYVPDEKYLDSYVEAEKYLKNDAPRSVEYWQNYTMLIENLNRYNSLSSDRAEIKESIGNISPVKELKADKGTNANENIGIRWDLITSAMVRFLILGLMFFVVKIFVNLYRYFLRLAAFYEARADGIALANVEGVSLPDKLPPCLTDLFSALSPDNLDLGSPPKTPVDEVAEAASKIANASAQLLRNKG